MKYIAIASVASLALLAACSQGGDSAKQNAAEAVNATQDATSGVVGQTSAATVGANTVSGFVTGLATDFCVAWTAMDARKAGFEAYVIEDATRAIDLNGSLAAAWKQMAAKGVKRIQSSDIQAA